MWHLLAEPASNLKLVSRKPSGSLVTERLRQDKLKPHVLHCIKARQKLNLVSAAAAHLGSSTSQNCIMLISSKFKS